MFHIKTTPNKKANKLVIGMICVMTILAGLVLTPYQASADTVDSIAVDQTKTKLQYEVGSTIPTSDIYIKINESIDSTQCSTLPGVTIDVPENTAVGRKTVTINYGGQTTTYQIVVAPAAPSVYLLQKLDFDTVKAYAPAQPGITGVNFVTQISGATTFTNMGNSIAKTTDGKYIWDSIQLLRPGYTYVFKVRTYVDVNGERFYSAWSTGKSITLPALTGVNRWRYETKRQLIAHGVYTKYRENVIINIITHESGGNERAGIGRKCVGLLQFNTNWAHSYSQSYFSLHSVYNYQADNRLSGSWSLHRMAHLLRDGGFAAITRNWPTTWNL